MFIVGQIVTHVSTGNQVRIISIGHIDSTDHFVEGIYMNALSSAYTYTTYKVEYLDGCGNAYFVEHELAAQSNTFAAVNAILNG